MMTDSSPSGAHSERPSAADATDSAGGQLVIRAFIVAIHGALRAVRLYPSTNVVVSAAIAELSSCSARVMTMFGQCELRGVGNFVFVNETRLRLQLENYSSVSHVLGRLRSAGVGGVIVREPPDATAWFELLSALLLPVLDTSKRDRLARVVGRLESSRITCFDIEEAGDDEFDSDDEDEEERARQTFMRSLSATRELLTGLRMGRSPALKHAKRAVQGIVDAIMLDSTSIIGLTTLREFDDYTFVHSVNVCILSVALGRRIGLDKLQLLDLGLAALMHDIGKSRIPLEVLNKRGKLDEDEFRILQSHTWRGVLALFAMRGNASRAWRAMTTAYEHHMRTDLTGYPTPIRPRQPSFYSKIVSIVDGFDAATSTRVYQPKPWSPADVLRGMRDNPKLGLDPILVKAFINLTGVYPVGTIVGLDTLELGLVHAANPNPSALSRPLVRMLFDERGNRLVDGPIVDLMDQQDDGGYRRTIVKTDDPDRYGIRVGDYFA